MAEILFGSPSVRLNVNKVWRKLSSPEALFHTPRERKAYIAKMKTSINLDDFLKHSNRKMTHGSQKFWNYSVWRVQPWRNPVRASPNEFPIDNIFTETQDYKPEKIAHEMLNYFESIKNTYQYD
jgi:hypothetical protein